MKTVEDLANQMKVVEDLTTQMKENQVPSDLDINKEVQVSTEVSMFMQPEESTIESKQQEAYMLEESSMVHADLQFDKVEKVDVPIPHIKFVIPEKFHEVEYRVYLFSMLPKSIPQLQQVLCAKVFSKQGRMMQEQNQNYLNFIFSDFCIYLIGNWIIVDFYSDRD